MERFYFVIVYILVFSLPMNGFAFNLDGAAAQLTSGQKEYTNSNRKNRILIEVNAVSGVTLSGMHRVPDTTNLVEFISLAGGPEKTSDPSEVQIKRMTKNGFVTMEYDLEEIVSDPEAQYPLMKDGDVLLIERNASEGLLKTLSIVGISLGIIASGFLIRDALND